MKVEKPAKGTKGFILYSPINQNYFFRVYNIDKTFTDYKIQCEEIEVKLISNWNSLYNYSDKNVLDWSSKALGKTDERGTE